VIVAGATGMLGLPICRRLLERGDQVVVFSRSAERARAALPGATGYVSWSYRPGDWSDEFERADGIINLAGAPLADKRWTPAFKREIVESREAGTRSIVEAAGRAQHRPQVLVNASGSDYYGDCGDKIVDESAPPGRGFLPDVCVGWEREARGAEEYGIRTVMMRTGIVLAADGGALARLLPTFKLGVGGPFLPGTQWWSWVHIDDVVALFLLALDDERARGPLNVTAPNPVRNREFAATLGHVLHRPAIAPIPRFAVEIIAGEMAGPALIEKQRAIPRRALDLGYQFAYPTLEPALRALLA
jgi:uncharacterized protein (TIGR01777 family)